MTKKDKRFQQIIFGLKKEYRFEEIQSLLEYYGYTGRQEASSHILFRKKDYPSVNIVVHRNKVNQYYVKKMIRIFRKRQLL